MARELDITIKVDNDEALQKLRETDAAVDLVDATAIRSVRSIDSYSKSWDVYTVSAKEAAEVLGGRGGVREVLGAVADAAEGAFMELTLMQQAGVAMGAGYAAWKLGTMLGDFALLDTTIERAVARLMGWGNVAKEEAGAKADVLAKASAAVGYAITDMTEAMEINQKVADGWNLHLLRLEGPKQSTLQIEAWNKELDRARKDGILTGLTHDIQAHTGSQQELSKWYQISAGAIGFYTSELAATAKAVKDFDAANQAMWKADEKALRDAAKLQEQIADIEFKQRLAVNKQITAELDKQVAAMAKEQAFATAAELSAKEKVMAGYGLTVTGAPIEMLRDPLVKVTKALEDLERTTVAGVSQESQKQQLYDQFIKDQIARMPVYAQATAAANQLGQAHAATASAANAAAASFSGFSTMLFSLVATPHQQVPGGGGGGQWTNPYNGGAIGGSPPIQVGPFGASSNSSAPTINVAVNGNVDSSNTARLLADQVASKVMDRLKQNQRVTYSKT